MGLYHNSGYNTYNIYIDNWLVVDLNPSETWWSESQLGSSHSQLNEQIKFMFQTTNQKHMGGFDMVTD